METPRDPEQAEASGAPLVAEIAPSTTLGAVHLTITDLARSVEYYRQVVGLTLLDQGTAAASLGVDGREFLVLVEEPEAWRAAGHSGLYHFALLLPRRVDLAHGWRTRLAIASRSSGSPTISSARRST